MTSVQVVPARGRNATRSLVLCLAVLAVLYTAAAWELAHRHAFWCSDSGARFWTVQSLAQHGTVDVGYAFRAADPQLYFHPLSTYTVRLPGRVVTTFHGLFPWMCVPAFKAFGWFGLAIVPLIAGLLCIPVITATAARSRLGSHPALPWILGLATPLPLYAIQFWDHTLQILAVAAGLYAALRAWQGRSLPWAVAAGAVFGIGLWFHENVVLCAVAAVIAGLPWLRRPGSGRLAVGAVVGFVVALAPWIAANEAVYGLWLGPHLHNTNDPTRAGFLQMAYSFDKIVFRTMFQLAGDYSYSQGVWVVEGILLVYLTGALTSLRTWRFRMGCWLAITLVSAILIVATPEPNGLFEATPIFLVALAALEPDARRGARPGDGFARWCARTCAAFLGLVLLTGIGPGMDWGSRYLLTGLPFLVMVVLAETRRLADEAPRWNGKKAYVAPAAMLAVSLFSQIWGWRTIRHNTDYRAEVAALFAQQTEPAVVTESWWIGTECAESPRRTRLLWVPKPEEDGPRLASVLRQAGVNRFCYMGNEVALRLLHDSGFHPLKPPIWVSGMAVQTLAVPTETDVRRHRRARVTLSSPAEP